MDGTLLGKLLEWVWVGVAGLVGFIWKRHNEEIVEIKNGIMHLSKRIDEVGRELDHRIDAVSRESTPIALFEQNRKEVRDVQIKTFERLDAIGQSLARIEGKLDK